MAGVTYSSVKNHHTELIIKANQGSVFLADYSSPGLGAALTDTTDSGLVALPTGFRDIGVVSDDGAQMSTNIDTSDVSAWGYRTPPRSDITGESTTLQVTCLELNKWTIALYMGVAVSGITAASSGEIKVAKPTTPPSLYYHLLVLAVDTNNFGEFYVARYFPRAQVTDKDDQTFSSGDDPIAWPVTFTARPDSTVGSADVLYVGGPGAKQYLSSMGLGS